MSDGAPRFEMTLEEIDRALQHISATMRVRPHEAIMKLQALASELGEVIGERLIMAEDVWATSRMIEEVVGERKGDVFSFYRTGTPALIPVKLILKERRTT